MEMETPIFAWKQMDMETSIFAWKKMYMKTHLFHYSMKTRGHENTLISLLSKLQLTGAEHEFAMAIKQLYEAGATENITIHSKHSIVHTLISRIKFIQRSIYMHIWSYSMTCFSLLSVVVHIKCCGEV